MDGIELSEFIVKFMEPICWFFTIIFCSVIGYIIGKLRYFEDEKKLNDYENILKENENLKETIKIKNKIN